MREEAIWARNLDFQILSASSPLALATKLKAWRDSNLDAAVLDIKFSDGYSYAGRPVRVVDQEIQDIESFDPWEDILEISDVQTTNVSEIFTLPKPSPADWGVCSALIILQIVQEE